MVENPRAKGNRRERQAEEKLQDNGYSTARKQHNRYGASDFYNLYDIIAVKPGEPVKFIQIKSNSPPNLGEFKSGALEITPVEHAEIEIWVNHDYEGWHIRRLNRMNKEWETVVDERKEKKGKS